MSADLQWMLIRNNSSFLVKSLGKTLTKEPNNLTNKNSSKFNGLIHTKAVDVTPSSDGKGVVLGLKKKQGKNKPAKAMKTTTIRSTKGGRHIIKTMKNTLEKNGYCSNLSNYAIRRACALSRSQVSPAIVKKKKSHKKRN